MPAAKSFLSAAACLEVNKTRSEEHPFGFPQHHAGAHRVNVQQDGGYLRMPAAQRLDEISNAKRNQIRNTRFFHADAGTFMSGMAQAGEKADVVLMDPPRAGSDNPFRKESLQTPSRR